MDTRRLLVLMLVVASGRERAFLAHHGTSITYEMDKTISVTGSVTEFDFSYPHPSLFFDVKDDKGKVEKWGAEFLPDASRAPEHAAGPKKQSRPAIPLRSAATPRNGEACVCAAEHRNQRQVRVSGPRRAASTRGRWSTRSTSIRSGDHDARSVASVRACRSPVFSRGVRAEHEGVRLRVTSAASGCRTSSNQGFSNVPETGRGNFPEAPFTPAGRSRLRKELSRDMGRERTRAAERPDGHLRSARRSAEPQCRSRVVAQLVGELLQTNGSRHPVVRMASRVPGDLYRRTNAPGS